MKIVQIRGSNGTGKTTLAKDFLNLGRLEHRFELIWLDAGNPSVYATVAGDLRWAFIGQYKPESKMGGCDNMPTMEHIKSAIINTSGVSGLDGIVFEGMMISTTRTMYDFIMQLQVKRGIEPLTVLLESSVEGCLKRIRNRGTMRKELNVDNIATKCEIVKRHKDLFDPLYTCSIDVDKVSRKQMLREFLKLVGEKELIPMLL